MNIPRLLLLALLGVLAGCASVPEPIQGDEYSESFFPGQAVERSLGANVRWGGSIVETRPERDRTCVEILAHELDSTAYPRRSDNDLGRFIACRKEFIDPEIFVEGRYVTAVGEVSAFESGKVGEYDYRYPVLEADSIYLWPETADLTRGGYYPYHGFYGYRPYFHRFGYPYHFGGFHHHGFHRFGGFHHY